jgi:peptidoglycan hydrolase-like protein with peptidoglycan-binding domain
MALTSPRFANNARLQAASENNPPLRRGETGDAVAILQQALVDLGFKMPISLSQGSPDGIYGAETEGTVRQFQKNQAFAPSGQDGIAGRDTLGALDRLFPASPPAPQQVPPRTGTDCGNSDPAGLAGAAAGRQAFRRVNALRSRPLTNINLPFPVPGLNKFRPLSAAQEKDARAVFGASIDLSRVSLTDALGAGNRPFTFFFLDTTTRASGEHWVINLGTLTPATHDLIHELTHVWQSQHHSLRFQFELSSLRDQNAAVDQNKFVAQSDPSVTSDPLFPVHFPFSAYAYVPGKPFGEYGVEQIANMIEQREVSIIAHVKGVGAGVVDPDNVASLATTRIGDRRVPGTKF